jgi:hypothetical protein
VPELLLGAPAGIASAFGPTGVPAWRKVVLRARAVWARKIPSRLRYLTAEGFIATPRTTPLANPGMVGVRELLAAVLCRIGPA